VSGDESNIPRPTAKETQEWEQTLRDFDLSMWRGVKGLVYEHLLHPNDNDLHWTDLAAMGAPTKGGQLPRYDIGSRVNHLRVCQYCGIRFPSKRASAKFCSKKCRQRKPMLDERPCLVCGTPMQPKHKDARFHPECRHRGYRALQKLDSCASIQ